METVKDIALIIGNVGIALTLLFGLIKYRQSVAIARANKFSEMWRYFIENAVFVRIFGMIDDKSKMIDDKSKSSKLAQLPYTEKLLFLGFYEEVAILVNSGLMKKHVAHYMFSYYAICCWESDHFWTGTNVMNRDSPYWYLFRNFVKQMQAIEAEANPCLKNYKL